MSIKNKTISVILLLAVILMVLFLFHTRKEEPKYKDVIGWKEDFRLPAAKDTSSIPEGWKIRNKPGTPPAVFLIEEDKTAGISFLDMKADEASASILSRPDGVNAEKTPVLKWSWKAFQLPKGADGREKSKDDQAIGIYVGTGSMLNNKSISYRWDTDTPKGAEGTVSYGGGIVKVKWITLRNSEDMAAGKWLVEERNWAEDFNKAWGFYPEKIYLSVSCNSQYTNSKAEAGLAWIEFLSRAGNDKAPREGSGD